MTKKDEIKIEKFLSEEQINATPKEVLEQLFILTEEKIERYKHDEYCHIDKIDRINKYTIPEMQEKLNKETNPKYIKGYKANIEYQKKLVNDYIKDVKVIKNNINTLQENILIMAKVLGYSIGD